jgi:hypothetical protein
MLKWVNKQCSDSCAAVRKERSFSYISVMKKMLLIIITVACALDTTAQAYKDSLYRAYVKVYMASRESEIQFTVSLFETAQNVFSINHPVMRYAIKQSKMEDSLAIAQLGRETMRRFMNDKFLALACHHYSEEAVPILNLYETELCKHITYVMNEKTAKGKIPDEEMGQEMDDATTKGTIAMTKDPKFIEKTAKLKEDEGIDKIKESLECYTPYLYVNCPYVLNYMLNACVGRAEKIFMEYKNGEQRRMTEAAKQYILTGNTDSLKEFATGRVLSGIENSLKPVSSKVKELAPTHSALVDRVKKTGNKLDLSYVCAGKEPVIVGGILLEVEWKDHKWSIKDSDPIAAKAVKDKDALVRMGLPAARVAPVVEVKQ